MILIYSLCRILFLLLNLDHFPVVYFSDFLVGILFDTITTAVPIRTNTRIKARTPLVINSWSMPDTGRYPMPTILSASNCIKAVRLFIIVGKNKNMVRKIAMILGTKTNVISCTCVKACNKAIETPTTRPTSNIGRLNWMESKSACWASSMISS